MLHFSKLIKNVCETFRDFQKWIHEHIRHSKKGSMNNSLVKYDLDSYRYFNFKDS